MAERSKGTDDELSAITQVIEALEPLDELARSRVLDYVFRRLGLRLPASSSGLTAHSVAPGGTPPLSPGGASLAQIDIRSLKNAKNPTKANEMAAIVAYYLGELAPAADRKDQIDAADIRKYFKQAEFRLPGSPSMTLVHARNAGYLDAAAGRGRYKLNPVGYNLVVHNLPSQSKTPRAKPKSTKPKRKTSRPRPKRG